MTRNSTGKQKQNTSTGLADDIDPEGRELTLEDLVTARGHVPASLQYELHNTDVWGPPVSSAPFSLTIVHQGNRMPHIGK